MHPSSPWNNSSQNDIALKKPLQAILFDLDGTLIDSVGRYVKVLNTAFNILRLPQVSERDVSEAVKEGEINWSRLLPVFHEEEKRKILDLLPQLTAKIYDQIFDNQIPLIPGVLEVIPEVSNSGFKMAIVTSTPRAHLNHKLLPLHESNLIRYFGEIIAADDTINKKPSKDPLILCAERFGIPTDRCMYVGDMRVDIRAGKAAGMITVGVLTGFDTYQQLKTENPDTIIESVAHLFKILIGICS
jgi:HAD superfamily hydrolase (TIGR01549 family)